MAIVRESSHDRIKSHLHTPSLDLASAEITLQRGGASGSRAAAPESHWQIAWLARPQVLAPA